MLSPGDTLGHYRILARLRAGGMATLYLGQRSGAAGFTRPVAIKVIHPHLAENPRFVEMFVDEARLSAKLDDPHIVHVEELGEANGTYFLVMEYVDGVSLAQLLRDLARRKRALSVELATWIAMQIASGLHAAHEATDERGMPMLLVHRDVSPHNVLLAFKGHVKVIDFGVAKAIGHTKDTQTGSLRGKIAYMPPEQAFGQSVDRRADVYALGIVLWEMLTMRRLFQADNDLALLEQVRRPRIDPPSRTVAGIPPALDAVVMRALAPDASARPPTAEDLRKMLAEAVPSAVTKTARDVAAMIAAVLPEQLEDSRRRLVELLGSNAKIESSPQLDVAAQEALATMTIERPEATIVFEDDRASADPAPVVTPVGPKATQPMLSRMHVPTAAAGPPQPSYVLPILFGVVLCGATIVGGLAIVKARARASVAPTATVAETVASPSVSAPPPASSTPLPEPSTAVEPPPSSTAIPITPKPRTAPPPARPGKPSTATTTAPTASVEIINGVPVFKKNL